MSSSHTRVSKETYYSVKWIPRTFVVHVYVIIYSFQRSEGALEGTNIDICPVNTSVPNTEAALTATIITTNDQNCVNEDHVDCT